MITKRDFQIMCKISNRCHWLAPTECDGCWYKRFCDNFAQKPKDWDFDVIKKGYTSINNCELKLFNKIKNECMKFLDNNNDCKNCIYRKICGEVPCDWVFEYKVRITKNEYIWLKKMTKEWQNYFLVRDKCEDLNMFKAKPWKDIKLGIWKSPKKNDLGLYIGKSFLKNIKWSDKKPKRIIDYIREYEQWQNKIEKK